MNPKIHLINSLLILFILALFAVDHQRLVVENLTIQALLLGIITGDTKRKWFHLLNMSLFATAFCAAWLHHFFSYDEQLNKMLLLWLPAYLGSYLFGWGIQALVKRYRALWSPYFNYSSLGLFYLFVFLSAYSFFYSYDTMFRFAPIYWAIFAFSSGLHLYKQGWKIWQHGVIFLPYVLMMLEASLTGGLEIATILSLQLIGIALGILLAYRAHWASDRYAVSKFTGLLVIGILVLLFTNDNLHQESDLEMHSPWAHQGQQFLYEGDTITLDYFEGKVLVLDFWNTTCGLCFQKFPQLEKLHKQFENDPNVLVLAVNSPLKRDPADKAKAVMEDLGYSFGNLYALDTETAADFDIHYFPVVLYAKSEAGNPYYKGSLELKWHVLRNSNRIIRSLRG